MKENEYLISKGDLIKLINNQGNFRKFYVTLGENVTINFKHIRPRKRKGDSVEQFSVREGCVVKFD